MKDVGEPSNGLHIKSRPSHDAAAAGMDSTAAAVNVSTPISSSSIGTNSSELDPKGHRHTALLAPIPIEKQLNLRWERICAYVSTDYDEVGVLTKTLQRCRGQEVKKEKKQVGGVCLRSNAGVGLQCRREFLSNHMLGWAWGTRSAAQDRMRRRNRNKWAVC
jgi:hypothetical protein